MASVDFDAGTKKVSVSTDGPAQSDNSLAILGKTGLKPTGWYRAPCSGLCGRQEGLHDLTFARCLGGRREGLHDLTFARCLLQSFQYP